VHAVKRAAAVALASAAGAAGIALAGAGTASAAPTYIGPLYYEVTPISLFDGPVQCNEAVAAERAAGNIILVDCLAINDPSAPFPLQKPASLRVGIDVNGS
jgi:hypothetical protein